MFSKIKHGLTNNFFSILMIHFPFTGRAQENSTALFNNLKKGFSDKMYHLSQSKDLREVINIVFTDKISDKLLKK